jgi:hypothetical protein
MKASKFLLIIFFISVIAVMYSLITKDVDKFMYSAGFADMVGFVLIYLNIKSNKAF